MRKFVFLLLIIAGLSQEINLDRFYSKTPMTPQTKSLYPGLLKSFSAFYPTLILQVVSFLKCQSTFRGFGIASNCLKYLHSSCNTSIYLTFYIQTYHILVPTFSN